MPRCKQSGHLSCWYALNSAISHIFVASIPSLYSNVTEPTLLVNFWHTQPILRIIEKTDPCAMFKEFIRLGYPAWPILRDRLDEFSKGFSHVDKKLLGTAILSLAAKFAGSEIASLHYLTQSSNAVMRSSFPPQDRPDKVFILLYCVTSLSTLLRDFVDE